MKYYITIETIIVDEYEVEAGNRASAELNAMKMHHESETGQFYYNHYDICERDRERIETVTPESDEMKE